MSDKSWEPAKLDTLGMLNNFCFHVYAQKSLSQSHTLSLSHSLSLDMLNNFCSHVYAQKVFFLTSSSSASAAHDFANHRAGSQLTKVVQHFPWINISI